MLKNLKNGTVSVQSSANDLGAPGGDEIGLGEAQLRTERSRQTLAPLAPPSGGARKDKAPNLTVNVTRLVIYTHTRRFLDPAEDRTGLNSGARC